VAGSSGKILLRRREPRRQDGSDGESKKQGQNLRSRAQGKLGEDLLVWPDALRPTKGCAGGKLEKPAKVVARPRDGWLGRSAARGGQGREKVRKHGAGRFPRLSQAGHESFFSKLSDPSESWSGESGIWRATPTRKIFARRSSGASANATA